MDSDDLTFDDIRRSLNLLKHCSVCLYQGMDARLERTPRPAMDRKMNIPTGDLSRLTLTPAMEGHRLPTLLLIPEGSQRCTLVKSMQNHYEGKRILVIG